MATELHLDPDRLHLHGRRLAEVLDGLVPLPGLAPDDRAALAGSPLLAEFDHALDAVGRAGRVLADLAAELHGAASGTAAADVEAGRLVREAGAGW